MGKKIDGIYSSGLMHNGLITYITALAMRAVWLFYGVTFFSSFIVKLFKPNAYNTI